MSTENENELEARFLATLAAQSRFDGLESADAAVSGARELLQASRRLIDEGIDPKEPPARLVKELKTLVERPSERGGHRWVRDLNPWHPNMPTGAFLDDAIRKAFPSATKAARAGRKKGFLDWLANEEHISRKPNRKKTDLEKDVPEYLEARDRQLNALRKPPEVFETKGDWLDLVNLLAAYKEYSTSTARAKAGSTGHRKLERKRIDQEKNRINRENEAKYEGT